MLALAVAIVTTHVDWGLKIVIGTVLVMSLIRMIQSHWEPLKTRHKNELTGRFTQRSDAQGDSDGRDGGPCMGDLEGRCWPPQHVSRALISQSVACKARSKCGGAL